MKVLIIVCVISLAGLSQAEEPESEAPALYPTHSRGCIYIMGRCVRECEEGTHAYALGCGYKTPESTCEEPNPKEEEYQMCDYSDCYCDAPTVRDTASGKCVQLSDCPKRK